MYTYIHDVDGGGLKRDGVFMHPEPLLLFHHSRTKKVDIKTNNDKNKPLHFLCMYDWALFYFCVVEFTAILLHTG